MNLSESRGVLGSMPSLATLPFDCLRRIPLRGTGSRWASQRNPDATLAAREAIAVGRGHPALLSAERERVEGVARSGLIPRSPIHDAPHDRGSGVDRTFRC